MHSTWCAYLKKVTFPETDAVPWTDESFKEMEVGGRWLTVCSFALLILILSVGYSDRSDNSFVSYFFNLVWGSSESVRIILFLYLRVYVPCTVYLM